MRNLATQHTICVITDTLEVTCVRSSRTVVKSPILSLAIDRIKPVLQRFKLSSCTALIGEQPNLWNLFQIQDAISQHRGAKQSVRLGLSQIIGLLSLAYLLFVDR